MSENAQPEAPKPETVEAVFLKTKIVSDAIFEKGQRVTLTRCQFNDLASVGIVAKAPPEVPARPEATAKSEPKDSKQG